MSGPRAQEICGSSKERLVANDFVHRFQQISSGFTFRYEPSQTNSSGCVGQRPRLVHGEHHDGRIGEYLKDLFRGFKTIHYRHCEIHKDNIGF